MTYTKKDKKIVEYLEGELIDRFECDNSKIVGKRFLMNYNKNTIQDLIHKLKHNKLK